MTATLGNIVSLRECPSCRSIKDVVLVTTKEFREDNGKPYFVHTFSCKNEKHDSIRKGNKIFDRSVDFAVRAYSGKEEIEAMLKEIRDRIDSFKIE